MNIVPGVFCDDCRNERANQLAEIRAARIERMKDPRTQEKLKAGREAAARPAMEGR